MKRFLIFGISAFAVMALTFAQTSHAQQDPTTGKKQNRGLVKPNFVDEDGDGICDNQGAKTGTGTGIRNGTRQGKGRGTGNGTGNGTHLRLRDGSCGQTPVQDGSGSTNTAKSRRNTSAAPSK